MPKAIIEAIEIWDVVFILSRPQSPLKENLEIEWIKLDYMASRIFIVPRSYLSQISIIDHSFINQLSIIK
jgi:hypothetical protein